MKNVVHHGHKSVFHFTTNLSGGGAETQMLLLINGMRDVRHTVVYQSSVEDFRFQSFPHCHFMTIRELQNNKPSSVGTIMHIWIPDVFTYLKPTFFYPYRGQILVGVRNRYAFTSLKRVYQFFCYLCFGKLVSNTPMDIHPLLYRWLYQTRRFDFIPNAVRYDTWINPVNYDGELSLLFVGRLVKQKGIESMMNAIKTIPESTRKKIQLKVVGRGPEESVVRSACALLPESVSYEGYSTNPLDYYRQANFLILPSFYEGMPNVAFEALSQSTVLILSDIPQNRRWFTEENSFFFEPGNAESLKKALLAAANIDIHTYAIMLKSGRKVLEKLSIAGYVRRYREVYTTL